MNSETQPLFEALKQRVAAEPTLAPLNVLSQARGSVRLGTQRVPYARIELGESRIGGIPDVPRGFEWPRWLPLQQRNDKCARRWEPDGPTPLGFIAQIDLKSVPRVDDSLPTSGWLYFFYDRYCEPWGFDPADRGCCCVVYANCDRSRLVRAELPVDVDPEHVAHPCLVEAWPELTLPEYLPDIQFGDPAFEVYRGICDDLVKAGGLTQHRLLGHPQLIQSPMELECQLASHGIYCGGPEAYQSRDARVLEGGAIDWRLLLQIDTDEAGPGWMWGDVGRIYFWITKQDLASLRFDDMWLIFQCC